LSRYEKKFDGTCPLTVRRAFRMNGRQFFAGESMNWKQMGIPHRRVRQMVEAGKLEGVKEDTKKKKALDDLSEAGQYWEAEPDDLNLEEIDDMKELRRIADKIGAPYKVSKADQRKVIQEHQEKQV